MLIDECKTRGMVNKKECTGQLTLSRIRPWSSLFCQLFPSVPFCPLPTSPGFYKALYSLPLSIRPPDLLVHSSLSHSTDSQIHLVLSPILNHQTFSAHLHTCSYFSHLLHLSIFTYLLPKHLSSLTSHSFPALIPVFLSCLV